MNNNIQPRTKILIADDHPVVREGLSAMLSREKSISVIGEATNGKEAIDLALKGSPDVVLMDLRMPVLDGVEAIRQIKSKRPDIEFIIITTYDDDENILKGIEAGAKAYLLKDSPREKLFQAIKAVSRGESLIEPAIAGRVIDRLTQLSQQVKAPDALSEREIEVLSLIAEGTSNKEIARDLCISQSTVKTHIQSIFQKLDVNDRTEAVTKAIRKGLIGL